MTFVILSSIVNIKVQWGEAKGKASHHLSSSPQSGCLSHLALETLRSMVGPVYSLLCTFLFPLTLVPSFSPLPVPSLLLKHPPSPFHFPKFHLHFPMHVTRFSLGETPPASSNLVCCLCSLNNHWTLFRPCFQHLAFYILFVPKIVTEHRLGSTHIILDAVHYIHGV